MFWQEADGRTSSAQPPAHVEVVCCDAFSPERCGILRIVSELSDGNTKLHPDKAWVETYDRNRLIDTAPSIPETAAHMAQSPERIPCSFKRML